MAGRLLDFAVELFVAIVQSSIKGKPQFTVSQSFRVKHPIIKDLMSVLSAPVHAEKASRQTCFSVAYILAHSLKADGDSANAIKVVKGLVDALKNETLQIFGLYALGEIGRIYPRAFEVAKIRFV